MNFRKNIGYIVAKNSVGKVVEMFMLCILLETTFYATRTDHVIGSAGYSIRRPQQNVWRICLLPPPPPPLSGTGIAATPAAPAKNDNTIREKVDIESTYPGGPKAWKRFLLKTFRYPVEAEENRVSGTVLIRFVVNKDGNIGAIQALSGPEELRAEAIRVISRSGKWTPAVQNGNIVNSYKYQQIVFQLSE